MLRSCHCPNAPWGGLAKRAWLVDEIRQAVGAENTLLLDAGDLLPTEPEPERDAAVLDLYRLMRYDAVAIGDQEAPFRAAQLSAQPTEGLEFPWLSGGFRLTNGPFAGLPMAPPCKVFKVAGRRVGVVSVVGPDAFRFSADKLSGLSLTEPAEQVAAFVERFGASCELVVVLSHQGEEADRRLAGQVTGVDLLVGGHSQSLITPPIVTNGVMIVQAGKNGENLGVLVMSPKLAGVVGVEPDPPNTVEDPFAVTQAEGWRWRAGQRLIPMNTAVDEAAAAAAVVDGYYRLQDERVAARLNTPAPAVPGEPRLVVENPFPEIVLRAGETQRVEVRVANAGEAPLKIERVRSKIAWLAAADYPRVVEAGQTGILVMAVAATNIDRFFRSEFTITTSDKTRIVVGGSVNGRVEGPLPGILDVKAMMAGFGSTESRPPMRSLEGETPSSRKGAVRVEFFFSAGCADCEEVKRDIFPAMAARFGESVEWEALDIGVPEHYLRLARLQEALGVRTSENVSIYVDGRLHLGGLAAIRAELADTIDRVQRGLPADVAPPLPAQAQGMGALERRLKEFTVLTVAAAGLVDGFNPCAFSTIIFFITWLSATGVRERKLVWVGLGYMLATFLTYWALGFGLFHALKAIQGYRLAGDLLKGLMIAALMVMAWLSFRDAWRFKKTGRAESVTLQLSEGMKQRIHRVMRTRLSSGSLFMSAAVIGFLVTLLESVCTGQVYVPTLALMARESAHPARAMGLLTLYNAAFVAPLAGVIVAVFLGARNPRLLEWSQRNVVGSKCAMGVLFVALAVVLVLA